MSGLIVLLPYASGEEFYLEEYDEDDEDEDYDEDDEDEDDEDEEYDEDEDELVGYLPIHVQTEDPDLAVMAVAYEACVNRKYVAFSSADLTVQDWEDNEFPGTLNAPTVELPVTDEAFKIPKSKGSFCCASMNDYEVLTLEEMLEQLKESCEGYILPELEDEKAILKQFNEWSMRVLDYSLPTK